jgi:hypothetical protein
VPLSKVIEVVSCAKASTSDYRHDAFSVVVGARPQSPCEGSLRAVHPVILVAIHQETLVDGTEVNDGRTSTGPPWPITAGRQSVRADRL